jgi:hypothetical protein
MACCPNDNYIYLVAHVRVACGYVGIRRGNMIPEWVQYLSAIASILLIYYIFKGVCDAIEIVLYYNERRGTINGKVQK